MNIKSTPFPKLTSLVTASLWIWISSGTFVLVMGLAGFTANRTPSA